MKTKKTCIIVDSSACIRQKEIRDVYMVPLSIIETSDNNEKVYKELIDIDSKMVIKKIIQGKDLKTSQSSLGEMIEILEELTQTYDRIFVLSISSGISGSYNTWNMAREEFKDKEIIVLDGKDLGYGNQVIVETILEMIAENKTTEEIVEYVEQRKSKRLATLIVTDISQLKKGGRISTTKAWIVDKLKLNIIITFDGALDFFDKAKSIDKAIEKSLEKINQEINYKKNGIKQAFFYSTFVDDAKTKEIQAMVDSKLGFRTYLRPIPSTIAVHIGANAFTIYIESN